MNPVLFASSEQRTQRREEDFPLLCGQDNRDLTQSLVLHRTVLDADRLLLDSMEHVRR